MPHPVRRIAIGALALALPFSVIACGGDDDAKGNANTDNSEQTTETTAKADDTGMTETTMAGDDTGMASAAEPFGSACASVPKDGAGSFAGMAKDPVATAASNNPALSTLVKAVGEAGLGDTLNNAKDITVFAPANPAFDKLPAGALDAAMKDPKGQLTDILENHVVMGRLTPEDVAGEHKTLGGGTIKVEGSGEDFNIGDAKVVCGNVQTANATVYIIDGVLLPS